MPDEPLSEPLFADERALSHRYAEVKKRIGLSGAGRGGA
jgi:hypothetical protein